MERFKDSREEISSFQTELTHGWSETGFFTESTGCNTSFRKNPVSRSPCVNPTTYQLNVAAIVASAEGEFLPNPSGN
jgi:hypothetical protein